MSYPPPPTRKSQSNPIEMQDLSAKPAPAVASGGLKSNLPPPAEEEDGDSFDEISYWAIGASSWLFLLSLPLLLFPRILLFFSQTPPMSSFSSSGAGSLASRPSSEGHYDDLSPLERYLCTQMGLGLVAVSGMGLLLIAPPTPSFPHLSASNLPTPIPTTLRLPFCLILSTLLFISSVISYNSSSVAGGLATFVAIGGGGVGIWGFWVGMFGGGGYRSRKTGADKRTSSFPFYNKASAHVQKQEWKKEQKSK